MKKRRVLLSGLFLFLSLFINTTAELNITNKFSVDSTSFDTTDNTVKIYWSVDTTGVDDSITIYSAISWSYEASKINSKVYAPALDSFNEISNLNDSKTLDLGHFLLFDKPLYLGIWMRAKSPSIDTIISPFISNTNVVADTLDIPSFKWQKVSIPAGAIDSSFPIANGKILFQQSIGSSLNIERVELSENIIDNSFINFNMPNVCFKKKPSPHIPFKIGFKITDLPINLVEEQTGVYVIKNEEYFFKHNYEKKDSVIWIDYSTNDFIADFIDSSVSITMLADTVRPEIIDSSVISPSTLQTSATEIATQFKTLDNISNVKWKILYGRGDQVFSYSDSGYCDSVYDSISHSQTSNLNNLLFATLGTRIYLVISDGINRSIKDLSLTVSGNIQYSLNMNSNKWVPIYSKVKLNNDSIHAILNNAVTVFPEGWEYDKTEQRFFRYINVSGSNETTGWLEYSDTTAQHFKLEPGQIFWCKSRDGKFGIPYGTGQSNSLTEPYPLKIIPNSFTDFTLPYYFNILIDDIASVNDDSLFNNIDIYKWEEDSSSGQISAVPVHMSDSTHIIERLTSSTNTLASSYTIYNNSLIDTLMIPGIYDSISEIIKDLKEPLVQRKRIKKRNKIPTKKNISYIKWRSKSSGEWGKLLISTGNINIKERYAPSPISFGNVSVFLTDEELSERAAYATRPSDINGITTFKLLLRNKNSKSEIVQLSNEHIKSYTSDYNIYFLKEGHLFESGDAKVTIPPNSTVEMSILAGSRLQLNSNNLVLCNYQFKLLNSFPNPFKNSINLKYRLPQDIKEVQIDLYNSLGKKVYSFSKIKDNNVGTYMHNIDIRNMKKSSNSISSGAYFLKMSAHKSDGKKLNLEKKLICIK